MGLLRLLRHAFGSAPSVEAPPPEPPPGEFVWSAPRQGGEVSYAVRQAVRARVGEIVSSGPGPVAFLVDVDLDLDGGSFLSGWTLYYAPRAGDWTPVIVPSGARIHEVNRPADEATTTRLAAGTGLTYLAMYPDDTEGLEGSLFRIEDGPFVGDLLFLGEGGRYGAPSWATEATLVPAGVAQLEDVELRRDLLPLMQAVAVKHGAPGFSRSGTAPDEGT